MVSIIAKMLYNQMLYREAKEPGVLSWAKEVGNQSQDTSQKEKRVLIEKK